MFHNLPQSPKSSKPKATSFDVVSQMALAGRRGPENININGIANISATQYIVQQNFVHMTEQHR